MIDGQTHTHTQATTIPEGQNWPRVTKPQGEILCIVKGSLIQVVFCTAFIGFRLSTFTGLVMSYGIRDLVTIVYGYGLLPDSTKPLPKPMLNF